MVPVKQQGKTYSQRVRVPKNQIPHTDNFLEAVRSVGQGSVSSLKEDLLKNGSRDFLAQFGQLLGVEKPKLNASGELKMGESLEMETIVNDQNDENKRLKLRLAQEQNLREQDKAVVEEQTQSLKLQIQELVVQTQKLASSTQNLTQEVKIAATQAPVDAGVYHLNFFERLISIMKDFRKKIENASLWLHSQNQRSVKMRMFWGQVGKSGAKRLLSSEDYMTRSAG